MKRVLSLRFLVCMMICSGNAQVITDGFSLLKVEDEYSEYLIYEVSKTADSLADVKFTYVAESPFSQFKELQQNKKILLVASASYSSAVMIDGDPVGFCADNGVILNKMPHPDMDALVVINPGRNPEYTHILNLEYLDQNGSSKLVNLNPRENLQDVWPFITTVESEKLSAFQSNLLYDSRINNNPPKENDHGKNDRSRRYFIQAEKDGKHVTLVVDVPRLDYLMRSANKTFLMLQKQGYGIRKMVNLETGSKDIFHVFDGNTLVNMRPNPKLFTAALEYANNLLIFYHD